MAGSSAIWSCTTSLGQSGEDLVVQQVSPPVNVSSPPASVELDLQPGDKVWAVPCAIQAPPATLTQAMATNGNVTVNYVEVEEIG